MNVNKIGSWIYYNEPVTVRQLVRYTATNDRKAKALLSFLTYRIPIYENNNGTLGINLELLPFKDFVLLEPKDL